MRYFHVPDLDDYESRFLPDFTGKTYAPLAHLTLGSGSILRRPDSTRVVDLDGESLVIEPDTASWAFLTAPEVAAYSKLVGQTHAAALNKWAGAPAALDGFVGDLYRRGLLTIDGHSAVDSDLLRDSHNTPETYLVELLVTEKCNLGCVYCLAGTTPKMPRMTPETAIRAIDLAFRIPGISHITVELSGGEPFLEYDLMRTAVAYIRRSEMATGIEASINIQTNCTLLDAERVAWVLENGINVGISLDGTPEAHNRSRPLLGGKGSFEQVVRGMDLLQRRGVRFGALVVLNRFNIGNPRGLVEFLVENGVTGYKLNPIAYLGAARDTWQDSGVRQEEVVDFVREVTEMVAYEGYPLVESNVRTMCEFLVSKRRATRCMRGHCGAGDSFQAVAAAGDIYPCGRSTQSPELKLGNVRDDIRSLDEPGRHNLHIVEIRNRRSDHLEGCQTCEYRQLCQAGCSAEAFERYGTVRHRTPQCHFFKTSYPWLMRWLSFDAIALARLAHYEYFGDSQVRLVDRSYVDDASPTLVGVP